MPFEDPHHPVRLASAANIFQANAWQQQLEQEGIRCQIVNDFVEAIPVNLPGSSPEVWIEAADLARAEAILRRHQTSSEATT